MVGTEASTFRLTISSCTLRALAWINTWRKSHPPLLQRPPEPLWKCYSLSCVWLFSTSWTVAKSTFAWNSPGKNTGVGAIPFSVQGILHERILEWFAIPVSSGSSQPRDQTRVSCIADRFFTIWAETLGPLKGPLSRLAQSALCWHCFLLHLLSDLMWPSLIESGLAASPRNQLWLT